MCQLCTAHDECAKHALRYTRKHAWINNTPLGEEYEKEALRLFHLHASTYVKWTLARVLPRYVSHVSKPYVHP